MPVELVTPTAQTDYITFKLRAPDAAATVLKALKPGEWVTITPRHRPSSEADAVVAIKPYVQSERADSESASAEPSEGRRVDPPSP